MVAALRRTICNQAAKARHGFLQSIDGDNAFATQDALLAECVRANRDTSFGEEHGFANIRTIDDYRRAVPIRHYDDLEPWISRSAGGEERVLTAQEPIRFWKTTGTTSASKKIPVTPASALRNMEGFLTLQGTQLHYHPELDERPDTMLVTHLSPKTVKEFCGPRRVPYCSTTEAPVEVRSGRDGLVAPWVPKLQSVVEDDSVRLYFLLCYAALHDLYNVTCLHPSRFQTIASMLRDKWPQLVEDLRAGTVHGQQIRDPAPERAAEIERIGKTAGTVRPIDLWPNLTFVASWSGSYIERYRPTIEECFCSGFMPMPSISSEAFATMPIDEDPISQPINIRGGVFEFIPAEQKVDEFTPTLQFHELEVGESYEIVLTTLGGLYRYAMCDIFKVIGYTGRVPRVEYYGRRSVSDLTGEKLAEEHVEKVVGTGLKRWGVGAPTFAVCGLIPGDANDRPKYVLLLETPQSDRLAPKFDDLAADLDRQFRTVNSRYELKRNFGDLKPLEIVSVSLGTFGRYRESLVRRGMPAGQLKDKVLHKDGAKVMSELLELSALGGDLDR
jgi:hypothetical protein